MYIYVCVCVCPWMYVCLSVELYPRAIRVTPSSPGSKDCNSRGEVRPGLHVVRGHDPEPDSSGRGLRRRGGVVPCDPDCHQQTGGPGLRRQDLLRGEDSS